MLNSKILLYKHKTLKDGTHPVLLQIVHNEKPKRYTIGKTCMPNQWDIDKSSYTPKMPNYRLLNMILTKEKKKVDDIIIELENSGKPFTFELFDRLYKGTTKPKDLYEFIQGTLILELEEKGKSGNSNVYKDTLRALKSYKGNIAKLQLEDIDYNFLIGFEHFLIKRNCGYGGISVYMRTLRAIINAGINRGYLHKDSYPFTTTQGKTAKYDISKLKSAYNPRGLAIAEMVKIKNFDSDLNSHLRKAHFYFLFSYYCY
ncbi:MAG TPA: phage integrase SAM-like domain and Arm DNA-binding domain-containing protein, partial [Saprospiraceae bacterium]|nr:phage integrase SAM-like domain and Arm DNA-binding domain-containing protein [Saprospiraceae bacterium]